MDTHKTQCAPSYALIDPLSRSNTPAIGPLKLLSFETFDFLGFTHYCRTTRKGRFGLGRKPIRKRVNRTLKRVKIELRRQMHHDLYEVAAWLGRVLGGWLRYFAVPTSFPSLKRFAHRLKRMWLRVLRRRSQKDRFTWDKVGKLAKVFWPPLRILHPWPNTRFAVNHPR